MPLYNLCGLRTNHWQRGSDGRYYLTSPAKRDFGWNGCLARAICKENPPCPKDKYGNVMIQRWCTCGMYASVIPDIVLRYLIDANSIMVVIEARDANLEDVNDPGHIWPHERWSEWTESWDAGWTAPGAEVMYLIDTSRFWPMKHREGVELRITPHEIAMQAFHEQFGVPVISMRQAVQICKIQWERAGLVWRKPVDTIMQEYERSAQLWQHQS